MSLQKPEVSYIRVSYIIVSYKRSCFFMLNLFLNWRIIDLQYCVVFCCTSTCISHRYTYIPSLLNLLPSPTPSYLSRLSQSTGLSSLCHIANSHLLLILHMIIYVSMLFSQFIPPSLSPTVSISLFSRFASPLLPCK